MDSVKVVAALRLLADAIEAEGPSSEAASQPPTSRKRRGSSANQDSTSSTASASSTSATAAEAPAKSTTSAAAPTAASAPTASAPVSDPFSSSPAPVIQPTIDEVMDAARALSAATSQQAAVDVLKAATGASNRGELKPEDYLKALTALKAAMPVSDPFGPVAAAQTAVPPASAAVQIEAPSLPDVKAAVEAAQKITSPEKVKAIIMELGGKVADPNSPGGYGPSLKALPVPAYTVAIERLRALPKTK